MNSKYNRKLVSPVVHWPEAARNYTRVARISFLSALAIHVESDLSLNEILNRYLSNIAQYYNINIIN